MKIPSVVPFPGLYSREAHAHLYQEACAERMRAALFVKAEIVNIY